MKRTAVIAIAAVLAGCAGAAYRPMIDSANVDMNRYESDLSECQQYAARLAGSAESAAAGAVAGAILGAVIASAFGGGRYARNQASTYGAISGGTGAGVQAETNQRDVIRRCLANRGYSVLL